MLSKFSLADFHNGTCSCAYEYFGCHKTYNGLYVFRVWAPHAKSVEALIYHYDHEYKLEMTRLDDGECFEVCTEAMRGDQYLFRIHTYDDREIIKADPYAFRSDFPFTTRSVIADEPRRKENCNTAAARRYDEPINIYEVNLLSWKRHKDKTYYSYKELEYELVPYVAKMGYTHVEFMPVTEFPYDGSWGYQVTGYFCPTSRLGTPEEFASLINAFHTYGIGVILDWVPAHFPKDDFGLYEFDGQPLYECPLWDRMEHSGWGTRKFDYGRGEVDSFLLSSAHFFLERYAVDGLRVDAVASMLYLDYDKNGDFTPNIYGDNRNLEAISFIRKLNRIIKLHFPGALTFAEESTSYDGVTRSTDDGGLGFDYKWNMGWMNDVLFYCRQDPYFRNHHHNKLTFSLMYAFNERFVLPLSHDEVVHVKGSIINKMPGEYEDKFAGVRLLLAFMYAHPGKKLNFMGYEVGQFKEWDFREGIEFFLTKYPKHEKLQFFVKQLNYLYKSLPQLYEIDDDWKGFEWLVVDDKYNNFVAFNRYCSDGPSLTAVFNFSGVDINGYTLKVADAKYRIIFNTDSKSFGGNGTLKKKVFAAKNTLSTGGKEYAIQVDIPKLSCIYLIKENKILGD